MHNFIMRTRSLKNLFRSLVKEIEDSVSLILTLIQPLDYDVFKGIKQNVIVGGDRGTKRHNYLSAEMYD